MLKIAYIATHEPAPKPKRLTKRQLLHQEGLIAIAHHRQLAREKVKTMFPELRKKIADLEKRYEELVKTKNLNI